MKNLFDAAAANEIRTRLGTVGPQNVRKWGTMALPQALAHCSASLEWPVGDSFPPRMLLGRMIGWMVRSKVLGNDEPLGRNTPTAKELVVRDERDLEAERKRLRGLIDRFTAGGPAGCTTHPHSFFGPLTPQEWAILMYKHLDHHLRQFGG